MLHAHPIAILGQKALGAQGRNWLADVLPIGNEQIVEDDPILAGKFLAQGLFGLIRGLGRHIPPSIGDPMHMNIDTDARLLVADSHDQIRCFSSYARQCQQLI